MSKTFKRNVLFFVTVMVTAFICIILPFISYINPSIFNNLKMTSAIVNVKDYDFNEGESVLLAGEWEFHWDKHIVSQNITNSQPDLYVEIPSSWTGYEMDGKKLLNGGIASYRAYIKNLDSEKPMIVSVQNLPGECKVFINGELVFSNRSIQAEEGSYKADVDVYTQPIVLPNTPGMHEIVVEVTCDYSSGLTSAPVLSDYSQYQDEFLGSIAARFVLVGIVAFFGVGSIAIGLMRKDMSDQIWLVLLCVTFIFRMLISNEGYIVSHSAFGNINYEIMMSLIYVSTYIIKLCMLMHLVNVLGLKINNATLSFISAVFLVCAFIPYFTYDYIYISQAYMWIQSVAYFFDVYMIYKLSGAIVKKKKFAPQYLVFYCITAAALVTDNLHINGFISASVSFVMPVACFLFISLMLFVHISDTLNTYKKAQRTAELEKELGELNITLMISQIQPHFLYNALNTIKYLIKKDPKTAEGAVVKFSNYLRSNMDSLTQKEPIPFEKELYHVKNYVDIEQLRFGDRLKIEYDIQIVDFTIPPLTLQPIVENAIKHGVNQRPEGGTVTIKTDETKSYVIITVEDNGVGFDINEKKNDGRSHVGIQNIRKRLEEIMGAFIEIKSEVGTGTTVTIKIPKNED